MLRVLLLIVLSVCCIYILTGCGKPNFAGRWEVTKITTPDGQVQPLGPTPAVLTFTPTADGYDVSQSSDPGVIKARWSGNKLVYGVDIAGTYKETVFSMNAAGKLVANLHNATILEARRL
jgi:hypothetical protein